MSQNTVEVDCLTKIYGSGEVAITAVDNVSFRLEAGEFVIILGPSGSGKTTLLSMLGGLLHPTSGSIVVNGQQIVGLSARKLASYRREKVGFVFQNYNLIPYIDAFGNLLAISHINKKLNRGAKGKAIQLLTELGLENRRNHLPSELSGGERQRVAIARALMNDPAIILVDEPTANLDTARGEQVVCMLQEQVKSKRKIGIMVTHDERMCKFANRTISLLDGRVQ
jgi:putative ABC transport system ATP-binding protein